MMKKKRREAKSNLDDDDNSQLSDMHVCVVEIATGKKLKGEDAPLASQINSWLESHPGWEVNDDTDDDDDDDDEGGSRKKTEDDKSTDVDAKEVILKAKVEDDEYKNPSEEHTYYSIAHTIHESITEQASIMVNGKLKEYQIKVFFHLFTARVSCVIKSAFFGWFTVEIFDIFVFFIDLFS